MSAAQARPDLAELALRVLDAAPAGVAAFDQACCFTYWNTVMEHVFGFREEEVLGRPASEVLPFLEESGEIDSFRRTLAGELLNTPGLLWSLPAKERKGVIYCTYRPLHDSQRRIAGGMIIVSDVTEQKLAEERAKEIETRFYRMADSSPVLLWMAGPDGLRYFFNQTWLSFTGRTLEQETGVGWAEGVHPLDVERCMDTYKEAFDARRAFEREYRLRRADGEFRWVLDRGTPRYGASGAFEGFIGSCTDITERKTLERALKEALAKEEAVSRLKSEFLANVSHELRTPLNAVINVPLMCLRDFPTFTVWECPSCGEAFKQTEDAPGGGAGESSDACPDCKVKMSVTQRPFYVGDVRKTVRFLDRMVRSGKNLLRLVDDILDLSNIDAGRMRLELAEVSLAELLGEVSKAVAASAEEKGVSITLPHDVARRSLVVDGPKIVKVLVNLVGNAVKFTPAGGAITVSFTEKPAEGCVELVVRDNGIGIPASKRDVIFESFRQGDNSFTRAYQGAGIGLSISKHFVELHGGRLSVDSREGEGSEFRFTLPARENVDQHPIPAKGDLA